MSASSFPILDGWCRSQAVGGSGDAMLAPPSRYGLNGEPESKGLEDRSQAFERRIARLRKRAIQTLAVQLRLARQSSNSPMSLGDIAER